MEIAFLRKNSRCFVAVDVEDCDEQLLSSNPWRETKLSRDGLTLFPYHPGQVPVLAPVYGARPSLGLLDRSCPVF